MKSSTPRILDPQQRKKMLTELESLTGILDSDEAPPGFDSLPVLTSVVDEVPLLEVPLLNDRVPDKNVLVDLPSLQQTANEMVEELVAAYLPRMEAELRLKLMAEVERILREQR